MEDECKEAEFRSYKSVALTFSNCHQKLKLVQRITKGEFLHQQAVNCLQLSRGHCVATHTKMVMTKKSYCAPDTSDLIFLLYQQMHHIKSSEYTQTATTLFQHVLVKKYHYHQGVQFACV